MLLVIILVLIEFFKVDKFFSEVYGNGCNVYTVVTEKGTAVVFETNGEFKVDAVIN